MASTNKTPHLGLCQWVETDPFLREDMNGDFARIDEAFGNLPKVKLFDITVTEAVSLIQIDFTGIDLTPYAELEMFFKLHSRSNKYMRMNGVTGSEYSYSYASGGSYTTNGVALPEGTGKMLLCTDAYRFLDVANYRKDNMTKAKFGSLQTLEFYGENFFLSGDRITIWGVRR